MAATCIHVFTLLYRYTLNAPLTAIEDDVPICFMSLYLFFD